MKKEHFEVLLEDIKGKVELILEGHASLDKKIDNVHDDLSEKIQLNSIKIDALGNRMDSLERKFDGLERKVDGLEHKVDNLEHKLDGVAADLSAHRADTEAHRNIYKVKEAES
jgi:chaperonin cofactor prefoldin